MGGASRASRASSFKATVKPSASPPARARPSATELLPVSGSACGAKAATIATSSGSIQIRRRGAERLNDQLGAKRIPAPDGAGHGVTGDGENTSVPPEACLSWRARTHDSFTAAADRAQARQRNARRDGKAAPGGDR